MIWQYNRVDDKITELGNNLPHIESNVIPADTESNGLNIFTDDLLCVQICDGDNAYITDQPELFKPILEDPKKLKLFHNFIHDHAFLKHRAGINTVNVHDTLINERMLTNGRNMSGALDAVLERRLGQTLDKSIRSTFIGHHGRMNDNQIKYGGLDTFPMLPIWEQQMQELHTAAMMETARLEYALTPVLVDMRIHGVGFDPVRWNTVRSTAVDTRNTELMALLKFFPQIPMSEDLFGNTYTSFNPASSVQLTKAFNQIGIKIEDVSERTLKQYLRDNPKHKFYRELFTTLMNYRKANSLSNLDLTSHINPIDGRIHGDMNQLGARTGRLSMSEPNLQNQQSTDELRACFTAAAGMRIADLDLSQIELVVMAELSGDPEMMAAVRNGEDLHTAAARLIFGTSTPTKAQRQIAKSCNFAAVFGSGADTFSITAGLPLDDARKYLRLYFERFPSVPRYGDKEIASSLARGYTINVGGRRRYIDDMIKAKSGEYNSMLKNYPVQSTAADIIKRALVEIYAIKGDARVILTVHDEILLEGKAQIMGTTEDPGAVVLMARRKMSEAGAYYLKQLPVKSSMKIADCWMK